MHRGVDSRWVVGKGSDGDANVRQSWWHQGGGGKETGRETAPGDGGTGDKTKCRARGSLCVCARDPCLELEQPPSPPPPVDDGVGEA